ncbi:probable protein S-acyltransferase 22 isoform X5 [Primulina huaijiensis]|uniref:probable protein S-acyltransferase 22 isoform X5 n=1 Tax=Primulina huaijiensis TaxID=1492673 RepID=UPI003CC70657
MMRRHGWQLPYHTLQVVAVAVFLTLGFAFYVLFAPFLGKMLYHYVVMGIYTPLIICVFGLYVWCAAVDPADPGVFRSKKYLKVPPNKNNSKPSTQKLSGEPDPVQDANVSITREETNDNNKSESLPTADGNTVLEKLNLSSHKKLSFLALLPCAFVFNSREQSSVQHMSEDGMFYCSLCEVEVFKYSKHCRVCDKCVDHFDHHCRCLNNCIGKRNYRIFFTLLMSALLLREKFSTDISTKLGSSFSVVPFVIVVGISTYDYIIALREQEQEASEGQHSPQMSTVSSITGFSSTSSFNNFHRAAWCTPPRRFLEDRFDVVPPDTRSVSSLGKKIMVEEPSKKKNPAAVKISPWTLARLNAEDVSKAAAEARKKSKTLRRVMRNGASNAIETDSSFGSSGRIAPRLDSNRKTGGSERIRLPAEMPLQPLSKISSEEAKSSRNLISETSTSLTILQHEARSAFRTGQAMPDLTKIVASSPDSSSDSPYIHPFQGASSASQKERQIISISGDLIMDNQNEIPFSRSTSGGYDASGGEDSDQISTRIIHGSSNWSSLLFGSEQERVATSYIAKP